MDTFSQQTSPMLPRDNAVAYGNACHADSSRDKASEWKFGWSSELRCAMCTSFTYQTKDDSNALARTMDFTFILNPDAMLVPRGYAWTAIPNSEAHRTRYAFTGLGRNDKGPLLADGVNEQGLSCAALYFPGFAVYKSDPQTGKVNLAPHEIVFWMLANFASVKEVRAALEDIAIVDTPIGFLGITPPLHWMVTDKAGETIVVEPRSEGLMIYDNPLGVMSNSPDFPWHLTNIRNYIGLNPNQLQPIKLAGIEFSPFGQGAGTFGLPGDYTPPARFLRVLFGKQTIGHTDNEADAVTAMFHLLFSVDIPKGSVLGKDGMDYTQHSCLMFCDSCSYYFKTYDNNQICHIDLMSEDLDAKDLKIWSIPQEQQMMHIN